MLKTCPKCNKIFDCQHNSTCWCCHYTLPDSMKEYLHAHYDDCICESCMLKLLSKFS